jgi:hypothetical protein
MSKTTRTLAALVVSLTLLGASAGAGASPESEVADAAERSAPTGSPRVLARTPWSHLDPLRDVMRPSGNLQRVVIANSRQQMQFTFDMVGKPIWDNNATDRATGMVFNIDWRGTTAPPNRILAIVKENNVWQAAIFNGTRQIVCSRRGGVVVLPNNVFRISAPVVQCLGGARVLRVGGAFVEDLDPSAEVDFVEDVFPNGRRYGPFIALPNRGRTGGGESGGAAQGWTVH